MSRLQCHLINKLIICLIVNCIKHVNAKGAASRGGSGTGEVCLECLGNYTEEEMNEALSILAIIMVFFLAVCSCQMYQRAKWELMGNRGKRPMPSAPYDRDIMTV